MENKINTRSLIGFGIMGVLMFIWFNWFMPKQETPKQTSNKTQNIPSAPLNHNIPKLDAAQAITLQNNELEVKINPKGGQLQSVLLKKYKAYDKTAKNNQKELYLLNHTNSSFSIKFKENKQLVETKNLTFIPTQSGNQLTLTAQTPNGGSLDFIYTLKDNYILDFDIKSTGINLEHKPEISVLYNALAHERGRSYEKQSTKVSYMQENLSDLDDEASTGAAEKIDWIAFKGQFFSMILDNKTGFSNNNFSFKSTEDETVTEIGTFNYVANIPEQSLNQDMQWYLGPNDKDILEKHHRAYQEIIPLGWFIFGLLNKYFYIPLYKALDGLGIFSAGIIILLMTIIVKIITSPIQYKMYKQSAIMRVLKPELDELNEKNKDADALKKQQATMDFYRKVGYNPMAGCLPSLIQLPIFMALINLFPNFIDLRGHSFLWADDLSAYDSIFNLPFNIPFYGNHISLFTLLYALTMLILYQVQGMPQQPTQEGMPNMKFMMYMMPVMLLFFINSYASGLSWYYFISNTITILLIFLIKKFFIDEKKIHAQIQENKTKAPKKKSKFAEILEQAQRQQALAQQNKGKK